MRKSGRPQGNEPVGERLVLKVEQRLYQEDPLEPLLTAIVSGRQVWFITDEVARYETAYADYRLSLERLMPEMRAGIQWHYHIRGRRKYGPRQRAIAEAYHRSKKFLGHDCRAAVIFARILLDRAVSLSRHFLEHEKGLGFTSFNEQKKFFSKRGSSSGMQEEYASYIRKKTDWFEHLKLVRDKFIIHHGPKHMNLLTYGPHAAGHDLGILIFVTGDDDFSQREGKMTVIQISIRRLVRDVHAFLSWFRDYGLRALEQKAASSLVAAG